MSNKGLINKLLWYIEHSRLDEMSMVEIDYEPLQEAADALKKVERDNTRYREALERIYGGYDKIALQLRDIAARALENE